MTDTELEQLQREAERLEAEARRIRQRIAQERRRRQQPPGVTGQGLRDIAIGDSADAAGCRRCVRAGR